MGRKRTVAEKMVCMVFGRHGNLEERIWNRVWYGQKSYGQVCSPKREVCDRYNKWVDARRHQGRICM